MQSVETLRAAANSLQAAKRTAKSDELFTLADKAWAEMFTAMRHAQLVGRFERASASERALAAKLSGQLGRQVAAEQARMRSESLLRTAQYHRAAAESGTEKAEKLATEVQEKTPKPEPAAKKANGNGTGGSGSRGASPKMRRGDDELDLEPAK